MCFGGDKIADLFKDQLQQLPKEIQQQFSKKALTWKNIPSRLSNRSMMDPNDLLGEWVHEDEDATVWMTVGTDQTIMNFMQLNGMEPAEGGVDVTGTASGTMNYMWAQAESYYGYDISFIVLSNNPLNMNDDYDDYDDEEIPEDIELPYFILMHMSFIGYGGTAFMIADTVDGEFYGYEYEIENGADYISVDTTTMSVDVSSLTVTSDGGDSTYTISGSIAPGTIDLTANTPFEMPFLSNDFGPDPDDNESMYFQFFDDGTGYEIWEGFYENYYGFYYEYTDSSEFEWSATDDSLTLIYSDYDYYYGYEESDTISLAYEVANDTLTFEAEIDFCEMMGDDYYYYYDSLDCFGMFEEDFGMTDIQDVTLDFWMELSFAGPLSIAGEIALQSDQFKLHQAYPNPFNPTTTLQYEMGSAGPVSINVFDVNGRKIRSLYNGIQIPGQHEIRWDAKDDRGRSMSSGVYLFKVSANGKTHTAKTLLLK